MGLGVSGHLRCGGVCIGQHLFGLLLKKVGVRLDVSDYLLCRRAGICTNRVRLTPGASEVFLGCPLGQSEHLEGLVLGGGFCKGFHLL
jgi:hypothetical protein